MSLYRYADACRSLAQEMIEATSEDDVRLLRQAMAGIDERSWDLWRSRNAAAIREFVTATPGTRRKNRMWNHSRVLFLQLTLAAIQHCFQAHATLQAMLAEGIGPGGSYRGMAARAGDAYWLVLTSDIPYWPFSDPSPFAEEEEEAAS